MCWEAQFLSSRPQCPSSPQDQSGALARAVLQNSSSPAYLCRCSASGKGPLLLESPNRLTASWVRHRAHLDLHCMARDKQATLLQSACKHTLEYPILLLRLVCLAGKSASLARTWDCELAASNIDFACRRSRLGITEMPTSPRTAMQQRATAAMSMPPTSPRAAPSTARTARAARTAPISSSEHLLILCSLSD